MIDTSHADLSAALSWRAYTRLANRIDATQRANGAGRPPLTVTGAHGDPAAQRRKPTRRERAAQDAQLAWLTRREETLEALRELRAETLPAPQSPDLAAAALFAPPSVAEVQALGSLPSYRTHVDSDLLARAAADEELSDDEAAMLAQVKLRLHYLARRQQHAEAHQLRPNNCWRKVGSIGERGGLRPGQRAYPAAWGHYLQRFDAGDALGEQWSSPLGRAWKRVERDYAGTLLVRTAWTYADPILSEATAFAAVVRTLHLAPARAERWLDAASRRIEYEMLVCIRGRARSHVERASAERAEADAWRAESEAVVSRRSAAEPR